MAVYESMEALVGNTPLLHLSRIKKHFPLGAEVFAKLEMMNPTGSAKDRPALEMLLDAERKGLIKKGAVIIEPTSGNTGIGLAAVAAARGYRVVLTMPDTMSRERINLLKAYGAEVVLTDGKLGMNGAVQAANALKDSVPGAFLPGQFDNKANAAAHEKTTGVEIYNDLDGKIDVFVAGVGTGGTLTGCARYLKKMCPGVKIIAVEPASSPLLSKGISGAHGLQGIGANFVPSILDRDLIDDVIPVSDRDAFETAKLLVRTEGIFAGITSGASVFAAFRAAGIAGEGKNIVAILPDSGTRYLSSGIYE